LNLKLNFAQCNNRLQVPRQNQCGTSYSDNRYSQQIPKLERNGQNGHPTLSKPWINDPHSHNKDHHWDLKPDPTATASAATTTTILKVPTGKKDQNVLGALDVQKDQNVLDLVKSLDKEGQKATDKIRKKLDSNGENHFYPRNGVVSPTSSFGPTQRALTSETNSTSGTGQQQQQQQPYPEKGKSASNGNEYNRHYQPDECQRHEQQVSINCVDYINSMPKR